VNIEHIDVDLAINSTKVLLKKEKNISPALAASLEVLLLLVQILLNRRNLNSRNSSKPPSGDPNRKKVKHEKSDKKAGGQKGHKGFSLSRVDDPDEIKTIVVDTDSVPDSTRCTVYGYEARQVIDIDISRYVIEYRAQILVDDLGNRYKASFPDDVKANVQYGLNVKVNAVYMSQYQLLPYDRVQSYFDEQMSMPVGVGTIFNFNKEAYKKLAPFELWLIDRCKQAALLHADETGININADRHWLHCLSNEKLTYFAADKKRGSSAMDSMDVLPFFKGTLCHDHWKPYYGYACTHSLCNAHHLRELQSVWEQDKHEWAQLMQVLLLDISKAVESAGGKLLADDSRQWRIKYRKVLAEGEVVCPPPDATKRLYSRGRMKRSKARNLLERLSKFEDDVLRFMDVDYVPFTNNQGENDLRMTKVQQKISGCFRSEHGAQIFCRVRSYLSTCRKNGVSATEALSLLFKGKYPSFIQIDSG